MEDDGTVDEWQGKKMNTFTVVILIISAVMCCVCSVSCYYNYRVFRTNEPPFPVPKFCPDCLFPQRDYKKMLEEQRRVALEESFNDDSQSNISPSAIQPFSSNFPLEEETPQPTPNDPQQTEKPPTPKPPKVDKYKMPELSDLSS